MLPLRKGIVRSSSARELKGRCSETAARDLYPLHVMTGSTGKASSSCYGPVLSQSGSRRVGRRMTPDTRQGRGFTDTLAHPTLASAKHGDASSGQALGWRWRIKNSAGRLPGHDARTARAGNGTARCHPWGRNITVRATGFTCGVTSGSATALPHRDPPGGAGRPGRNRVQPRGWIPPRRQEHGELTRAVHHGPPSAFQRRSLNNSTIDIKIQ